MSQNHSTIATSLPCQKCGNTECDQPVPGLCEWCAPVVAPDQARGAAESGENIPWRRLYHAVNRMMAKLGSCGSIYAEDLEVYAVMNAMYDIDQSMCEEVF